MVNIMESSKSQQDDRLEEPVAPATPDGKPPYGEPAPEELDLSGPDRSLRDSGSGRSEEQSPRTNADG
jgi:hypothetical protein